EMRGQAKLADQHNFLTRDIDRYHHDDLAGDQYIALLQNRRSVLGPYGHTVAPIITIGFGEHFWLRQKHVKTPVGPLTVSGHNRSRRHPALSHRSKVESSGPSGMERLARILNLVG